MDFPEKLNDLRKKAGLSQKELAEKLGVAQASINYWEKGQRTPSIDMVMLIAEYFNVSVDYLVTDKVLNKPITVTIDLDKECAATFDEVEQKLLTEFNVLNNRGKQEAIQRVSELKYIPRYTGNDDAPFT